MKIPYPITIISDTHIGHTASMVRDPEQLAPLCADGGTVVFNGDTVEMLWKPNRDRAREQHRRLSGVCRREGAKPLFVNGNHDPFVSAINHLDLLDQQILITHGDILFHEVAPWSRDAHVLGPLRTRFLRSGENDALEDFERQLLASKWASLSLEMKDPCSPGGVFPTIRMVARELWPPWRFLRILRFWAETPGRAAGLARMFRPDARFVIIGHTHNPGVWAVEDRIVVNTGAYLPFSRRLAVRIDEQQLAVHRVVRQRKSFRLGRVVQAFRLDRPIDETDSHAGRRIPRRRCADLPEIEGSGNVRPKPSATEEA